MTSGSGEEPGIYCEFLNPRDTGITFMCVHVCYVTHALGGAMSQAFFTSLEWR